MCRSRPAVGGGAGVDLHIALQAEEDGAVAWEIYSDAPGSIAPAGEAADDEPGAVVHSQGRAVPRGGGLQSEALYLDIAELRARGERVFGPGDAEASSAGFGSAQLYALFGRMGLSYGAAFRVVGGVWSIREADGQVSALGELRLPRELASTLGEYVLHPSLLDGALQTGVGLEPGLKDESGSERPAAQLPFALERLEVFAAL